MIASAGRFVLSAIAPMPEAPMALSPAIFIGHGNPMNTLESNRYTQAWRDIGRAFPKPRAVLMVSAHWFFGATAVTAMPQPRTIHDFYGFPPELFAFDYPAPGAPELAEEIAEVTKPHWVGLDRDQWGLDHGAWSVLAHIYPDADVPVVQLSINALKPLGYHLELAATLAPLRERGVMIVCSGNVVHNLKRVLWDKPDEAYDWAERFDDAAVEQMASNPADVLKLAEHSDFAAAVPTPDHFIPLLYVAGLAAAGEGSATPFARGYAMGSISMTCYAAGPAAVTTEDGPSPAELPEGVPPEQTNI
jgi:4,5-DOPA dioxygenase extradiol